MGHLMGGVRIGGTATVHLCRIIPYVIDSSDDGVTNFWTSIWMNTHGFGPLELTATRWDRTIESPQICDPVLCPTNDCLVAYAVIPAQGTVNLVAIGRTDDVAAPVTVATTCNNACVSPNIGVEISMEPCWHPSGSMLIYRNTKQNTVVNPFPRNSEIRRVDADGSNDTLLNATEMSSEGRHWWPQYNFDGSRIAAILDGSDTNGPMMIYVMDADGSNFTPLATVKTTYTAGIARVPFAWANTQDTLVYYDWDNNTVHTVNGDGTGDTTIYTDTDPFWGFGAKQAWLTDDSAIVYSQYNHLASAPKHTIGTLDPGGGGFTALSPTRKWYGQDARSYPRLFPQDGRIWWQEGDVNSDAFISSVLPDGTDYTVEQDLDDTLQDWATGFSFHT